MATNRELAVTPSSGNPSLMGSDQLKMAQSQTEYRTIKYHHLWVIKNYVFFKDKEEPIKSPKFRTPEGSEWYLRLHPLGFQKDVPNRNYISVYLCLHHPPGNENTVYAKHRGKLLPADENVHELVKYMERSATQGKVDCFNKDNFSWGWPEFTSHRDLLDENKKFMRDCNLQVLWYMEILEDTVSYATPTYDHIDVPSTTMALDFERLFKAGSFSDFIIKTDDGGTFRVHKAVLTSRNKYFASMLAHETRETLHNEVTLPDTQETMSELVRFIYTDDINESSLANNAENLLAAAEKYEVSRLKAMCEKDLLLKIDADSAPRLLMYGDLYNSPVLKSEATAYIRCHRDECMNGRGWQDLQNERHFIRLMQELLRTIIQPCSTAPSTSNTSSCSGGRRP